MKFDELDKRMRVFETLHDQLVLPNIYMVARIDGRSFTRLTKEVHKFESPFDERFRDLMVKTVVHLMDCGFNIIFGYTQSDEISLLFHLRENTFNRKLRKLNSVLAGEASAKFSSSLGDIGAFDCRICELPNRDLVVDYFRWRTEDAHRNALNAYCYWTLRKLGWSANQATNELLELSVSEKNELLFQKGGINFNDIPLWQKRGIGFYWEVYSKIAYNPISEQTNSTQRRRIKIDYELPMKEELGKLVYGIIESSELNG